MREGESSSARIAATYIGTVVGAGFASGQEVLQFFGLLGPLGVPAIAVAILGFLIFGFAVMEAGRVLRAPSHEPVMRGVAGRYISPFLDFATTFFLFGALSAMISGSGSVLDQEFGIPWLAGSFLMALLTVVTVLFGLRGVVYAVSSVVPFLIMGVLIVSVAVLHTKGLTLGSPPPGYEPPVRNWVFAGSNYVSYNMIMAAPVLSALGGTTHSRKQVVKGAVLGSVGLGVGLLFVYLTIVSSFPEVVRYEVPLARLASEVFRIGKPLYTAVFLAEVYTTAVANLYGFAARITAPGSAAFRLASIATTAVALWAGSAGFSTLVRLVYPAVGWAGMLFLGTLAVYLVRAFIIRRKS
ncbi:MAG TPA: hypothetical protein GXX30_01300 [Firmicutes bacterium]|nr:hypothetical protein [Candidatus Fermentithermobacillaceae bacterium]